MYLEMEVFYGWYNFLRHNIQTSLSILYLDHTICASREGVLQRELEALFVI